LGGAISFLATLSFAISTRRHSAFASCIWRGLWHATRTRAGEATTIAAQRAREVATFSRFIEYRNSIPRDVRVVRRHDDDVPELDGVRHALPVRPAGLGTEELVDEAGDDGRLVR